MFNKIAINNNVTPKLRAKFKSPREVSRTILVVITRVLWAILPPTIITAPTSDNALPSPVNNVINKSFLPSNIMVYNFLVVDACNENKYSW